MILLGMCQAAEKTHFGYSVRFFLDSQILSSVVQMSESVKRSTAVTNENHFLRFGFVAVTTHSGINDSRE